MRKLALAGLMAFLLASCSTESKRSSKQDALPGDFTHDEDIEAEFDGLKNSDFDPPQQVAFEPRMDQYVDAAGEGPLARETLDRGDGPSGRVLEAEGPVTKAVALCYRREFAQGLELLDALYRRYHKNPSYWNQVGTCHQLQGQNRKAMVNYNQARDLDAKYAPAVNNIGTLLYKQGRYQKALDAFKKARELRPFSKTPSFNLAQLYLKFGMPKEAKALFTALQTEHPADAEVTNGLATSHLMLGEVHEALALFESIDSKALARPWMGISYALALKLNKQDQEAANAFSRINDGQLGPLANYHAQVASYLGRR